jgi:hypothetical protein
VCWLADGKLRYSGLKSLGFEVFSVDGASVGESIATCGGWQLAICALNSGMRWCGRFLYARR